MKTKKLLRKNRRTKEKAWWKRSPEDTPSRSKMIGRFGYYEIEYYWA